MAISDDFTIDPTNRRIYHSSGTTVYTVNEFYSYLMDYYDESGTIDDTVPMTAQTPTSYTLVNGWFLNFNYYPSTQFLNGGSLSTDGWNARNPTGYANGIRVITFVANPNTVLSDIGKAVVGATTGDSGILLDFDNTAKKWWIRVDALGDEFDIIETISITSGTGSGTSQYASVTGENVWSNLYTIGTIEDNTKLYLYQSTTSFTGWWTTGHIDILVLVKAAGTEIDSGNVTVYARQYGKLYDHSLVDASGGGRIPVPLSTTTDTNNTSGTHAFDFDGGSGTFVVGDVLTSGSKKGVITSVTQSNPTGRLEYYLIYPHTQFANNDAVTGASGGAGNVDEPVAIETVVAGYTDITVTFGTYSRDLNNGSGARTYYVEIDCNQRPLLEVYEYLKYVTREVSTTTLNSNYGDYYTVAQSSYTPEKSAPFGTYAGGQFYGARGVYLKNVSTADISNYVLTDSANVTQSPPTYINLIVQGLAAGDRVGIYRTTGDNNTVDKSQFTIQAVHSAGVAYIRVTATIPTDTPASGSIRVVRRNASNKILGEERYQYSSFNNTNQPTYSSFILSGTTTVAYATTDTVYIPLIDQTALSTSITTSIIYYTDRYVSTRVRSTGYLPFISKGQITTAGLAVSAIKTEDTIAD